MLDQQTKALIQPKRVVLKRAVEEALEVGARLLWFHIRSFFLRSVEFFCFGLSLLLLVTRVIRELLALLGLKKPSAPAGMLFVVALVFLLAVVFKIFELARDLETPSAPHHLVARRIPLAGRFALNHGGLTVII